MASFTSLTNDVVNRTPMKEASSTSLRSFGSYRTPTKQDSYSITGNDRDEEWRDLVRTKSSSPRSVVGDNSSEDMAFAPVNMVPTRQNTRMIIKNLNMMTACLKSAGCIGGGAVSAACCNDETLSPSFLVFDGLESISLGYLGSDERPGDRFLKEAIDRWTNRIDSRVCVGNVSYEYRQAEEKFIIAGQDGCGNLNFDEQLLGAALNLVKTGSIVSQNLVRKPMPQGALDVERDENRIFNNDRYLPPIHRRVADHLIRREYHEALQLFKEIIQKAREKYGERDLIVSMAMHNSAMIELLAGRPDEALYHFHEAVQFKRFGLKEDGPLVADSLVEVGNLLFARGELDHALKVFHDALRMYGKNYFLEEDTGASRILNNIGCIHLQKRNLKSALSYLHKARAIQRMSMGSTTHAESLLLNLSITQSNIGHVKFAQENYDDAAAVLEEALLVQESVLGDDNETVRNTIKNIALCRTKSQEESFDQLHKEEKDANANANAND